MSEPSILITLKRDPLKGLSKKEFISKLQECLKDRVLSCYLFGSITSERFNKNSDVDVLIVKETKTSFPERAFEFSDLFDLVASIDILVYTPEEFNNLTTNPTTGFWTLVVKSMEKII